jgi:hypothetical protein
MAKSASIASCFPGGNQSNEVNKLNSAMFHELTDWPSSDLMAGFHERRREQEGPVHA